MLPTMTNIGVHRVPDQVQSKFLPILIPLINNFENDNILSK